MSAPQSSNVWLPGVVLLALAAISYLVHESAYQTSRPVERGTRSQALTSSTEVEARLWQDPLHAIDEHFKAEEAAGNKARNGKHHDAGELKQKLDDYLTQRGAGRKPSAHATSGDADASAPADLTVLAVMVPDAPYAEPTERRRRIRYAVLSGLSRQRLVPQDQEHIHFFRHDRKDHHQRPGASAAHAEPVYVAYEFLDRMAARHNPDNAPPGGAALVLWIPTEASQTCPLSLLQGVMGEVAPSAGRGRVRYAVMGPPESGTLLELVRETLHPERCAVHAGRSRAPSHIPGALPLEIYSPWASAASPELAYSLQPDLDGVAMRPEETAPGKLGEALQRCVLQRGSQREAPRLAPQECDFEEILAHRLRFVRMIADDSLLANALLDELALRGVDPACAAHGVPDADGCFGGSANRHRIALVSEWDAPYQRALRLTLARTIRERCERRFQRDARCEAADPAKGFDWLMRFSYLRGIDGRTADGSEPQVSAASKAKSGDPAHPLGEIDTIERAEGNAQFDYVRRLAARIEERDRELQRNGQSGIGAIGVLGTDPYDKLVILQALHARFPDKLFFTSNLDARLTHPQEAAWARNLIVVSDFDLALAPGLQRDIPSLRDAYQTAALFATHVVFRESGFRQKESAIHAMRCHARNALGIACKDAGLLPTVRPWLVPLVFEIGRTEAIRLPHASDRTVPGAPECNGKVELACLEVHPGLEPAYGAIPEQLRIVSALAVGIALGLAGLLLVYAAKPKTPESSGQAHARKRLLMKAVALAATLAALATLFWNPLLDGLTEGGLGEPAHLFEGVSIWPAEAIRLVIVVLAIAFLIRSHRRLQTNREDITRDFALPRVDPRRDHAPRESLPRRTKAFFTDVRDCLRESFTAGPDVDPCNVESLWRFYLRDGRACARWCRVICLAVLFTALAVCAFAIWPDFARFRGAFSFAAERWLFAACVVTFNFLLFYVIDALVICTRCVRRLAAGLDWPYASQAKFQAQYGANTPLDEWMSVQIVARRTEAVGRLVYMPFILLFLIIVARNSVFERWTFAPSVVALLTASAGLIVLAAWRLRETTETVRRNALNSLTDRLIKAQGTGGQGAQQIGLLIAELRELRKGAFAPYTDQTFIRALLLPLAGYATSALIEYMSLVRP